ncbi:MAG TPA: A24 family peptidase [Caulobacteraceae bacterium]|nr:A24 family peptidase [Caulobacteraceae bacterium]
MAPTGRVNLPDPSVLIRAALLVLLAGPAGWLAAALARREAQGAEPLGTAVVVAAVAIAFAWVALSGPTAWPLVVSSLLLAWSLVALAAIDLAAFRLPDDLTLPLLAGGLVVSLLLPGRPFLDHLAGAAVGWGVLAGLAWGFRGWRGVEGMGLGDAKLFGAAGAWLGWAALPSVMLIACAAAFVWVALRVLRGGRRAAGERIAFGAPLSLAILAVWLEGPLAVV